MTKIYKCIMLLVLLITLVNCSKNDTIMSPSDDIEKPSKTDYHYQEGSDLSTTQFYFADVNGDGMADKVYWDYTQNSGYIKVFLATGNCLFSTTPVSNYGSALSATKFYFADVNGDGKADKIYWNTTISGGNLRVYLATSNGSFNSTPVENYGSALTATQFYFADVNGDGKADKIYWNTTISGGNLRVYLATSNGSFNSTPVENSGSELTATKFYFADVNGDEKADKIYWNTAISNGAIRVYLATGSGYFVSSPSESVGSSNSATHFFFVDVDDVYDLDDGLDKIEWTYSYNVSYNEYNDLFWRTYSRFNVYFEANGTYNNSDRCLDYYNNLPRQSAETEEGLEDPYPEVNTYFADIDGNGEIERILWHSDYKSGSLQIHMWYELGLSTGI